MSELQENNTVFNKNLTAEEMLALMMEDAFTLEDQAEKDAAEAASSFTKIDRIRPKVGTQSVRILPLIKGQERKGYEYPLQQLFLKIFVPDGKGGFATDKNGKKVSTSVPVVNVRQVFPELKEDLITKYRIAAVAELKSRGADEAIIKLIDGNAFGGGLKYDNKRVAYCIDANDKNPNHIQMLELSYSQYKDVEEAKKLTWNKLIDYDKKDGNDGRVFCPMTSVQNGRYLDIIGKEENKKISYTFSLSNNDRDVVQINAEQMAALMAMPLIPSEIYRYTRFHFTATMEFLYQYDMMYSIGVFDTEPIQNLASEIESMLSKDDTRVFEFKDVKVTAESDEDAPLTIDALDQMFTKFEESGESEKSEAGNELRAKMKEFIAEEELEITVKRSHTLEDIWEMIINAVEGPSGNQSDEEDDDEEETRPSATSKAAPVVNDEPEDDEDDDDGNEPSNAPSATVAPSPTTGSRRVSRRPGIRG